MEVPRFVKEPSTTMLAPATRPDVGSLFGIDQPRHPDLIRKRSSPAVIVRHLNPVAEAKVVASMLDSDDWR